MFLPVRNVNISQWIIIPNSKSEQREELCLPAWFVLQTLKYPEAVEVPSQGLVQGLCGSPVGPLVHSTCLHCLHQECDPNLLMMSELTS